MAAARLSAPICKIETAAAPMPPQIICPSMPKFQNRTRKATGRREPHQHQACGMGQHRTQIAGNEKIFDEEGMQ